MLEIFRDSLAPEEDCVYLPDRRARMQYRLIQRCDAGDYQRLLERGWRRFGGVFFRPMCPTCAECRSLRIDVEDFRPNRSMRRAARRNRDLRVLLRPASISDRHLALYHRYHADMAARKGWKTRRTTPFEYFQTFVEGRQGYGRELLYLAGGELVAVALVDLLPRAVSAVYCYYEPALRDRSLGVFSILRQIALARERGAPHLYLGYWIADNESMRYKASYRPHQLLAGRPELDEPPAWRQQA